MSTKISACWFGVLPAGARATDSSETPDAQLPESERATLVEAIAAKLDAEYVFPDVAKDMRDAIRARAARGDLAGSKRL